MKKPTDLSKLLFPLLMSASLMLTAISAQAAVDMFLKLDGIDGEAQDDAHRNWIEITSFSEGLSAAVDSRVGGGRTTGTPSFSDLTVSKFLDRSSPLLRLKLAQGSVIPSATLVVKRAGATNPVVFFEILMESVILSSVSASASSGQDRLVENVTLNFAKITWRYRPIDNTGKAGPEVEAIWDVLANKEGL